jgi:hypothetical protein
LVKEVDLLGFEPRLAGPESAVLPLHNRSMFGSANIEIILN